jgi:uncharacterized membrane protein
MEHISHQALVALVGLIFSLQYIYICIGGWDVLEHEGMQVLVVWCYLQVCFQNALSVKEWQQERCCSVTLSVV